MFIRSRGRRLSNGMSENKPDNAGNARQPIVVIGITGAVRHNLRRARIQRHAGRPAASLRSTHADAILSPSRHAWRRPQARRPRGHRPTQPASASTVEPVDNGRRRNATRPRRAARPRHRPRSRKPRFTSATRARRSTRRRRVSPRTSRRRDRKPASRARSLGRRRARRRTTPPRSTAASARGSPPPDFGAAPDFTAANPPPPQCVAAVAAALSEADAIRRGPCSAASIAARARQLFDRAGQRITQRTLRIGVSARIFHPEPGAKGLRGKTLQYLEESIAHWVMSRDVLVFMIPTVGHQGMLHPSNIRLRDYAKHLDGLLLQGGADVSPQSYAEAATQSRMARRPRARHVRAGTAARVHRVGQAGARRVPRLSADQRRVRRHACIRTSRPTCRRPAFTSTSTTTSIATAIHFPDGSTLVNMFPGRRDAIVNSIHHQAVKTLGRDLNIEAVSASDGIIEAVRYRRAPFVDRRAVASRSFIARAAGVARLHAVARYVPARRA